MRNSVTNLVEMLIGSILICLGLIYLISQYRALSRLTDNISKEIIQDRSVGQQYSSYTLDKVTDSEIYAAIMGHREYPILIDGKLIPINRQDYEIYFSYIKDGIYEKGYRYDTNRNIIMIVYSHLST